MEFIYESSKPSFERIMNNYNYLKLRYTKEKKKLKIKYDKVINIFDYREYNKLLYKKNQLDIKYIKKIINIFKPILKNNVTIFLHGSYARNLNRWNSDIDLNILYKNDLRDEYLVVEEFIQGLLYKLFDFSGRDKIHNIMLYYPMYDKKIYEIEGNNHHIIYNKNIFNFECRNNYEKIYPLILNSSRDTNDLYKGIIEAKNYDENIYSFKGINKKGKKFIKNMLLEKDRFLINENVKYMQNIKLSNILNFKSVIKVSALNKVLKIDNCKKINNFLLNLKIFIILNNGVCPRLNVGEILHHKILKKYLSTEKLKEIEKNITTYRFVLDRLENLLLKLNINFSSRENTLINIDKISKEYYKLYNTYLFEDLKIIDTLNKMMNDISKTLTK